MKNITGLERIKTFLSLLFGLLLIFPTTLLSQQDIPFKILESSRLYIEGKSNVNSFTCDCKEDFPPAKMRLNSTANSNVAYFHETRVEITTEKLDCGNKGINRDLSKALKADEYPKICFELCSITFQEAAHYDEWQNVKANADITIAGKTKRVKMDIKAKQMADGQLAIKSSKAINMSDFGIDPPTVLMGLIKVKDEISLFFDLDIKVLKPLNGSPNGKIDPLK
ncbi:MAG: YceI family protein [Saprospiraceae bacterium]